MTSLKQGTLSFATAKRTGSTTLNGKQKSTVTDKGKKRVENPVEVHEIASDEEGGGEEEEVIVPTKRTRASKKARSSSGSTHIHPVSLESEKFKSAPAEIEREHLDVEDKAGRYRKYYNEVRSKMGHMKPIHSEGQNKIHCMLRFFDMSYEYGPCIGMTRLERWERAEAFGLNPPVEVRDILLTKEGVEKAEYAQCVLHGEV